MFKLRLYDLFYGFIRNYVTFGIYDDITNTKFTHRILGYFADVGRMLGMWVNYEEGRADLIWYYNRSDKVPLLHIEHENHSDRIDEVLGKLKSSNAKSFLGICYPRTEKQHEYLQKELKKLAKGREFLIISDNCMIKGSEKKIIGHYSSHRSKSIHSNITAESAQTHDEIWYAFWEDNRMEEEEKEI